MTSQGDVAANRELHDFGDCASEFGDVRFAPDGRSVLTCDREGTARRWDAATGKQTAVWSRSERQAFRMLTLPDGKGFLTPSLQGVTRVDVSGDKPVERPVVAGVFGRTICYALSADGKTLAVGGRDRVVAFWGVDTGKILGHLEGSQEGYVGFAFSPDGKLLAGCGHNLPIRIWDVATGKEVLQFEVKNEVEFGKGGKFWTNGANSVVFAPDGRSLLTVDLEVCLWEVATGHNRFRLARPGFGPSNAAFSLDGGMLAVGTVTGPVFVLETTEGKELGRLDGHRGMINALDFAPDGKSLVSGSADATALVWDVAGLRDNIPPVAVEIKQEDLPALWLDLADDDAARAYRAVCKLAATPKQAVALLKGRLLGKPEGAESERIARLIRNLDDNAFEVREKASKELAGLEDLAIPALRAALEGKPSAEVRKRVEALLEKRKAADATQSELRVKRSIEALQRSGVKEAVVVLEALAKGVPDALTRREAKSSLERLRDQPGDRK
jgi:hypothetical protein